MIVIPMAGLSSRFARAGYDRPKWMLPLANRPLFDWSLMSFADHFADTPFLIIFRRASGVEEFVRERITELGISDAQLVALEAPTSGQAETVSLGLHAAGVLPNEPLIIFNIDTIRPHFRAPAEPADGWVECFLGEGDHWSFVRPIEGYDDRAAEVVEKRRISPFCSTGIYMFRSAALFQKALARETSAATPTADESYVAPLYQHIIDDGGDVRFGLIRPDEIFFSGTPVEYEQTLVIQDRVAQSFRVRPESCA